MTLITATKMRVKYNNICLIEAVALVAQVAEQSLKTTEDLGLDPVIGNLI